MNMKRISSNSGFTLVEVVASAGIFVILGLITILFFIQGVSNWQLLTNQSDLRSTGRNVLVYMAQELGNATRTSSLGIPPNAFIASPGQNEITFYLPCNNVSTSGVCTSSSFATCTYDPINDPDSKRCPLIDSNSNTKWDTANQIKYLIVDNQLQRAVNGVNSPIASDISGVIFEDQSLNPNLNSNEVKVTLTLSRPKTESLILVGIVKLKNQ